MRKTWVVLVVILSLPFTGRAQDSLVSKQLDEVVVTATRNERTMGALPMPVTLVPKLQIRSMGSLRLNDVLTEQTGLVVVPQVNGQGNGIQLQGFNPDYTLILIDGEPIIGRYTGSLELSRITVGNIKQIEIVKGPSSSLYGSDALAGVINIITDRPTTTRGTYYTRYGTNNTMDMSGDFGTTIGKLGVYVFGNRYSTAGYDLSPENFGKTVSPFRNYTGNLKLTYKIGPKTDFSVSGRYFDEKQDFNFAVTTPNSQEILTSGHGTTSDWNINPVLVHRFSNRLKMTGRFYTTHYQTATRLNNEVTDTLYYKDDFQQSFMRPEVNAEYYFSDNSILTLGAGETMESVQTSRYGDEVQRKQQTRYAFFQEEWKPSPRLSVIAGGRFDYNTIYGSQFSPKLSTRYELNNRIALKGSFGIGFKAPDFRQLYFNFNNSAGGGYSVLGTEVVGERLALLESQGQIKAYLFDPSLIGKLQAERSAAFNFGARILLPASVVADVNLFYNSIDNLIESQAVAITSANQTIYSYRNIRRAFTEGVETNFTMPLTSRLNLSLGYQLLYAKDKDVVSAVNKGEVFWRDPVTLDTRRLRTSEYFGLYNRSRHVGNVKLFYVDKEKGLDASLRVIYRGRYGIGDIVGSIQGETIPVSDRNGNSILDVYDNFVSGYALVNISMAKTLPAGIRIQAGIDNLFNYTDRIYIPNIPGRLMYVSVGYSFSKSKNN
ncbi:MAG: TonB-dependent receptor [Cyclobacteriaceae bacterium]|nr:TonB-dependent receptor [Cytophagales bacterium]HNP76525.1 TonB-dependent receptor [Cyclobacteriaceae bacterium]HQQ83241.1 TonB-dependent receptor [Cyclobacteriaceae bacterium]